MLSLAGGLGEEAVVVDAALLGLVPIHHVMLSPMSSLHSPVDVSIISPSPGAAVVVAAVHVVALGVAVPVVRAAHSAPAPSRAQATVGDLSVPKQVCQKSWLFDGCCT